MKDTKTRRRRENKPANSLNHPVKFPAAKSLIKPSHTTFTDFRTSKCIKEIIMKRYCLALDLVDDPQMIREYEGFHKTGRPEILKTIHDAGITVMEIYRTGNRMFMIMETDDTFSFEEKDAADKSNPQVQEWEGLMWKYQQALPWAKPGEKWVIMDKIFETVRK